MCYTMTEGKLTIANLLLPRILAPKITKTHGISVRAEAIPPNTHPAVFRPRLSNIMPVNTGKMPPSTLRLKLCAASADEA